MDSHNGYSKVSFLQNDRGNHEEKQTDSNVSSLWVQPVPVYVLITGRQNKYQKGCQKSKANFPGDYVNKKWNPEAVINIVES